MFPVNLLQHTVDVAPTGSRVIANPPPTDTDEDWVVLVKDFQAFTKLLLEDGYVRDGKDYIAGSAPWGMSFQSFRKGTLNLIVTGDTRFFHRYRLATKIATVLNLVDKEQRVALFQMIRDLPEDTYQHRNLYASF